MEELLDTREVCRRMDKNYDSYRDTVKLLRINGLLRMFKLGKGYVTTEAEFSRFLNLCVEYQLDLSNKERIILAGEQIKSGRSSTPYRK